MSGNDVSIIHDDSLIYHIHPRANLSTKKTKTDYFFPIDGMTIPPTCSRELSPRPHTRGHHLKDQFHWSDRPSYTFLEPLSSISKAPIVEHSHGRVI
jgi:hypothetical protein